MGFSVVYGFVFRVDQKVLDSDTDPAVVRIRAMTTLHKGQVAFLVRKCHPAQQGDTLFNLFEVPLFQNLRFTRREIELAFVRHELS